MERKPNILIIGGEIDDARLYKRIQLLRECGANVSWAAYDRGRGTVREKLLAMELPHLILGQLADRRYFRRLFAMRRAKHALMSNRTVWENADAVYAINLDNLVIADQLRAALRTRIPLICEIADLRPVMTSQTPLGAGFRFLERRFLQRVGLLVTTSEAFLRSYFRPVQSYTGPVLLLENKVTGIDYREVEERIKPNNASSVLRVGFFSFIRCGRSLDLLYRLARELPERVEIVLRGILSPTVEAKVRRYCEDCKAIRYYGPFRNPQDLCAIYNEIDLCWNIHFVSMEKHSRHCLSNRIYEAGLCGIPQLGLARTEIGAYIERERLGWTCDEPYEEAVLKFFRAADVRQIRSLRDALQATDRRKYLASEDVPQVRESIWSVMNLGRHQC
jgi:succinoglycan biosynthesis protein ExoL